MDMCECLFTLTQKYIGGIDDDGSLQQPNTIHITLNSRLHYNLMHSTQTRARGPVYNCKRIHIGTIKMKWYTNIDASHIPTQSSTDTNTRAHIYPCTLYVPYWYWKRNELGYYVNLFLTFVTFLPQFYYVSWAFSASRIRHFVSSCCVCVLFFVDDDVDDAVAVFSSLFFFK